MIVLSTTVALAMAAVLLWAGLEKVRDLAAPTSTLRSLGVPARGARLAAKLVAFAELGVALGLVFRPDSAWTQLGVVTLAGVFALAGVLALWRDEPIRCNCFGPGGSGRLGYSQIIALLPWMAGLSVLYVGLPDQLPVDWGAIRLCALGLSLATWQAINVWRAQREARGDRLSAQEMYLWPH